MTRIVTSSDNASDISRRPLSAPQHHFVLIFGAFSVHLRDQSAKIIYLKLLILRCNSCLSTKLTDCQLRLDAWKKGVLHLTMGARKDALPGLRQYLQEHRAEWQGAFPAEFGDPPYETVYVNLTSTMEMPDVGDKEKLAEVVGLTERMVGAMVPLLDRYFETRDLERA